VPALGFSLVAGVVCGQPCRPVAPLYEEGGRVEMLWGDNLGGFTATNGASALGYRRLVGKNPFNLGCYVQKGSIGVI
ncbi:hypothetical protein, partial [Paenibacillus camerounensis]|uniref:hypothetical protein n=1 Tax=Paenibacillus camerounensis TaxID=1243663 RepID=UPI0005AAF778